MRGCRRFGCTWQTSFTIPRGRRKHDRIGDCALRPKEQGNRPRRARADGFAVRKRPSLSHTLGHDVAALSCVGFITTFQRARNGCHRKVTQRVPANFPAPDSVSSRVDIESMDPAFLNGASQLRNIQLRRQDRIPRFGVPHHSLAARRISAFGTSASSENAEPHHVARASSAKQDGYDRARREQNTSSAIEQCISTDRACPVSTDTQNHLEYFPGAEVIRSKAC